MMSKFKVGDRVRRTKPVGQFAADYEFTVAQITDVHFWNDGVVRLVDENGISHFASNCELVNIDNQIADLEKQLADLRAKKLEESMPKVGQTYTTTAGITAYVYENLDGRVFYRYRVTPSSAWSGMSATLQSFLENYDVK